MDKYTRLWHKFQASGRDVADIGVELQDDTFKGMPGRMYGGLWFACEAVHAPELDASKGSWWTMVDDGIAQCNDIEGIEAFLFERAVNDGWKP